MKKYRPRSWSEQAREFEYIEVMEEALRFGKRADLGDLAIYEKECLEFLRNSYRNKIVVFRAAKRLGRLLRAHK